MQAWESKAVASGIGLALGSASKEFFEQLYENKATVDRVVSASKKKAQ